MYAEFHVENDVYKYSFIKHKLDKDDIETPLEVAKYSS